jgi:hypothetical protein
VFTLDDYTVRLRDLGSTNGTQVNGDPVQGHTALKSGDKIDIGNLNFEIVIHDSQLTAPEVDAPSVQLDSITPPPEPAEPQLNSETLNLSSSETSLNLPVTQPASASALESGSDVNLGDTSLITPQEITGQPMPPAPEQAPIQPQQPVYQQPVPQQYYQQPMPPQPGMMPQMPILPPGMYPQMPQQYQVPVGYPAYPQQPMPQQPAAAPQQPAAASPTEEVLDIRLPPPETTGPKPPEPPAPVEPPAEGDAPQSAEVNPSDKAADIIKSYMKRRPSSDSDES